MNALLLGTALLTAAANAAEPVRIGAAGGVAGKVAATPRGGTAARALASGGSVFHKDAITTDAQGRLQVLLLDQTVFTMGPDSRIILDEFVYDPFTTKGKVAAEVTKGVFRFVTGKSAHGDPKLTKIKTPAGTIGIRGTFGAGKLDADGNLLVGLLGPGADNDADENQGGLEVSNDKGSVNLDEPGTGTIVKDGEGPSDPFKLSAKDLSDLETGGGSGEGSGDGSGGGASSSEEAGSDLAESKKDAGETRDTGETSQDNSELSTFAAQMTSGVQDRFAKWDDVRTIESGEALYYGQAPWNLAVCDGGACANGSEGEMTFQMNIDFGQRTYGGSGSSVFANDTDANANGGNPVNPSIAINQESFAALSGLAHISVSDAQHTAIIDILNDGGTANKATATLSYNDSEFIKGAGIATGTLNEGFIPQ